MPPDGALPEAEALALERWVTEGAVWPADAGAPATARNTKPWSLEPIREYPVPQVASAAWPRTPVDHFVLEKIEGAGLEPAPPADRRTLIRRASFDLVGLPPSPAEVDAFVADRSPDAFARLIDRLLASPHYGERWGRHWLDLVRYAETNGYEHDKPKPNAYRYRDYVVESFNHDVPYDQFVKELLAGDLLPEPRLSPDGTKKMSPIGTGGMWFQEMLQHVVDWPVARAEEVENQLDVFGKAVLGLTLGCARCHDHKFDPISAADYYSLAGTWMSTTNVQACVDTDSQVAEIRRWHDQIVALERRIQGLEDKSRLSTRLFRQRLAEASLVRRYLMATREILASGLPRESVDFPEVAKRHKVSVGHLKRWYLELEQGAERSLAIFRPWRELSRSPADVFGYRKLSLAHELEAATLRHPSKLPTAKRLFADFEGDGFDDWKAVGEAFGTGPEHAPGPAARGYVGTGFASSFHGNDGLTGRLVSPKIMVDRPNLLLHFKIAGGQHVAKTCLNLLTNSQSVFIHEGYSITGANSDVFETRFLPLSPVPFPGREVFLEIVDEEQGPWGHIMVDDFWLVEDYDYIRLKEEMPATRVNPVVLGLLGDRAIGAAEELAAAYARALGDVLVEWQARIEEYVADAARLEGPAPPVIDWLKGRLEDPARDELLTWATRDDSLLVSSTESEQFLSPEDRQALAALRAEKLSLEQRMPPSTLAIVSADVEPKDIAIQLRGDPHRPGKVVPRGFLTVLRGKRTAPVAAGSGRLEMAEWVTDPHNPLPARVMVNRIWQHHFGRGIVATPDEFGARGEFPTHPELLDHLARAFIDSGWSIKAMHRMLMLTSTYQQSSQSSPKADQEDPDNKLLSHMPVRRLDAECVRDAILAVAGTLDDRLGGPSLDMTLGAPNPDQVGAADADAKLRRSLYIGVVRGNPHPFLRTFGFPKPSNCVGCRSADVVPQQSLTLLNNPFVIRQAANFVNRVRVEGGADEQIVTRLYEVALARPPRSEEVQAALSFRAGQVAKYEAEKVDAALATERSWADLGHVMLNLSEFLFTH